MVPFLVTATELSILFTKSFVCFYLVLRVGNEKVRTVISTIYYLLCQCTSFLFTALREDFLDIA